MRDSIYAVGATDTVDLESFESHIAISPGPRDSRGGTTKMPLSLQLFVTRANGATARLVGVVLLRVLLSAADASARGMHAYGPKIISRDTFLPERRDGLRQYADPMLAADPGLQPACRRSRAIVGVG